MALVTPRGLLVSQARLADDTRALPAAMHDAWRACRSAFAAYGAEERFSVGSGDELAWFQRF